MRTVLNAVVRAPMAPTVIRRRPRTTRHTFAKWSTFPRNTSLSGATVCGFSAVKGMPYWQNMSMIENLPQKASRRVALPILSSSSGYACTRIGTPASRKAVTAPVSSPKLGKQTITPSTSPS